MKLYPESNVCRVCYVESSNYVRPSIAESLEANLQAWKTAPRVYEQRFTAEVARMDRLRLSASGDLPDLAYANMLGRVADACPSTLFWIPTRNWLVASWETTLRDLNARPNVSVRLSSAAIDVGPEQFPAWAHDDNFGLAFVHNWSNPIDWSAEQCGAVRYGMSCEALGCSRCYTKGTRVSYKLHGGRSQTRWHRVRPGLSRMI